MGVLLKGGKGKRREIEEKKEKVFIGFREDAEGRKKKKRRKKRKKRRKRIGFPMGFEGMQEGGKKKEREMEEMG